MAENQPLILLVEDEPGIQEAISIYLQEAGLKALVAGNGQEGLKILEENPEIQCVIADIMMPVMDGFEMAKAIRQKSDLPILFLSAKTEDFDKVHGFSLGADDYLTKPFSSMELIVRIKALLRRWAQIQELRHKKVEEEILYLPGLELNVTTRELFVSGDPVHLTPKEFSILELLMRSPGRVFSPDQIYEQVWKDAPVGTETVTVHVRRLREKIEPDPKNPQFIQRVWGVGYKVKKP